MLIEAAKILWPPIALAYLTCHMLTHSECVEQTMLRFQASGRDPKKIISWSASLFQLHFLCCHHIEIWRMMQPCKHNVKHVPFFLKGHFVHFFEDFWPFLIGSFWSPWQKCPEVLFSKLAIWALFINSIWFFTPFSPNSALHWEKKTIYHTMIELTIWQFGFLCP